MAYQKSKLPGHAIDMAARSSVQYERHKEAARARQSRISADAREIGKIPLIGNLKRRESCRKSLAKFCKTYNPAAFNLPWSPIQLMAIKRIEEAVFHGSLYAFAMPRGSGKSTLCRMAVLWAIAYAHCRYIFIIGANASKAQDTLEAVKIMLRFIPEIVEDFPELSYPIRCLRGIANKANGQTCNGESTMMEWSDERVVLPTVPAPQNLKCDKPMAPTSGSIIAVSGLTGDGIRGSLHTLITGEQVRPDFVLLDDPQTDESAASASQNQSREQLVAGAVLGMAGPGRELSAVMPCTVIRKGDFIDRILDRTNHPMWRGERSQMLTTMPTDMTAWEPYFKIYADGILSEPPNIRAANGYYRKHRKAMDAGACASWSHRKLRGEVSAIQHAMNIYFRNPAAFWAEYQNAPLELEAGSSDLVTAQDIERKTHGLQRGIVPMNCTHMTAFIDVQHKLLWWIVCAWKDDFTGYVVDYSAFPDQGRDYFTLHDAQMTLQDQFKGTGLEGSVYSGLDALTKQLILREWRREDGAEMKIDRILIDSGEGKLTDTIYQLCRQSNHSSVLRPSKGEAITASKVPIPDYPKSRGRIGHHWYEPKGSAAKRALRLIIYDTNYWKSFVFSRLGTSIGDAGSLSLFAPGKRSHRMFCEQITSEHVIKTTGRGRTVDEWKQSADRPDNHFLDCIVGCAVGASLQGVRMSDHQESLRRQGAPIVLSELQRSRRSNAA